MQCRRAERFQQLLFRLLCVRIEIDQLKCVNCLVIIYCLSVSCQEVVLTYKMGMYVPPYVKRRGLTELINLKRWVLSELKERSKLYL